MSLGLFNLLFLDIIKDVLLHFKYFKKILLFKLNDLFYFVKGFNEMKKFRL